MNGKEAALDSDSESSRKHQISISELNSNK